MVRIYFLPRRVRVVAALTVVVGLLSLAALAQLGSSGVIIPYSGYLELDGAAVDSETPVNFRFTLWNAANGGTACPSTYVASSPVRAGRFAVEIGPVLESCLLAKEVHLEVEVQDESGFVALAGRQQVHAAVAASTSGTGDFFVAGTLNAEDDIFANGDGYARRLRLSSTADVNQTDGESGVLRIGPASGVNLAMDNNEIMARDNGTPERLYLNYEGGDVDLGNASSIVRAPGALFVGDVTAAEVQTSGLEVTGNATGFIRGGGTRRCSNNSAIRFACDAWGTGVCNSTGAACGGQDCAKGTLVWITGLTACYDGGLGNYTAGCQSWVCVE